MLPFGKPGTASEPLAAKMKSDPKAATTRVHLAKRARADRFISLGRHPQPNRILCLYTGRLPTPTYHIASECRCGRYIALPDTTPNPRQNYKRPKDGGLQPSSPATLNREAPIPLNRPHKGSEAQNPYSCRNITASIYYES